MEAVEWLAPFKRYTERLREHVEHRTLEETVAYAAQETNLSWDTVKEIDKARLRRLYEHFHWDNSRRLLWMNSPFIAGIVTPQLCTPLIRRKSFGLIVVAPELRFESSLAYLRQSKRLK